MGAAGVSAQSGISEDSGVELGRANIEQRAERHGEFIGHIVDQRGRDLDDLILRIDRTEANSEGRLGGGDGIRRTARVVQAKSGHCKGPQTVGERRVFGAIGQRDRGQGKHRVFALGSSRQINRRNAGTK